MPMVYQPAPFEAIKARHILLLWPISWQLSLLALILASVALNLSLQGEADMLLLTILSLELGNLNLVWYFSRKLKKLGLPIRHMLASGTELKPQAFGRIFILNLAVVFAGILPGHLFALANGKWDLSFKHFLLRAPEESHALGLNLVLFLGTVVTAPIVEEILFRGLLLHRLAVKWGPRDAIWVSSLIFGLLHGIAPGIFLFGVVLALVYLKTGGSLRTTIALHAAHNLLTVLLINALENLGLSLAPATSSWWLAAELISLLIAGLLLKDFLAQHRQSWQTWPPFLRVVEPAPIESPGNRPSPDEHVVS